MLGMDRPVLQPFVRRESPWSRPSVRPYRRTVEAFFRPHYSPLTTLAPSADAHGEVKYNCWAKPGSIAEWKEEHIVIAVLAAWGVTISTAMKVFGGGDKEAAPAAESK